MRILKLLSIFLLGIICTGCIVPDTRVRVGVIIPASSCISCHSSSSIMYYNTHGYRPHYSSHYRAFPGHSVRR